MIATFVYIFLLFIWMITTLATNKNSQKKNADSVRDSGFLGVNFGTAAKK
jgi:hypothetical protein